MARRHAHARRRRTRLGALAVALTALSACGGGDADRGDADRGDTTTTASRDSAAGALPPGASPNALPLDACTLATPEEAQAAFAAPADSGASTTTTDVRGCVWTAADALPPRTLSVSLMERPDAESYVESLRADAGTAYGGTAAEVPGVGKRAYGGGGEDGAQVVVLTEADRVVLVQGLRVRLERLVPFARGVVQRLEP